MKYEALIDATNIFGNKAASTFTPTSSEGLLVDMEDEAPRPSDALNKSIRVYASSVVLALFCNQVMNILRDIPFTSF